MRIQNLILAEWCNGEERSVKYLKIVFKIILYLFFNSSKCFEVIEYSETYRKS